MLFPLVINPNFFVDIIKNEKLFEQTKNFIIKFDDLWEEIFIFVDDENESLKKEYENIIRKYSQEFPPIKIIVEKFLSLLKYKNVKITTKKHTTILQCNLIFSLIGLTFFILISISKKYINFCVVFIKC